MLHLKVRMSLSLAMKLSSFNRLTTDGDRGASCSERAPSLTCQLHPLVPPHVLHFMQVPLRTSV